MPARPLPRRPASRPASRPPGRPTAALPGGARALAALCLGGAVLLASCGAPPDGDPGGAGVPGANATVVRLVDGDTLHARVAGRDVTVRLIGIDTPESRKPNTPVECFAHEAADHLAALVPPGTPVRLEADAEPTDRYDRLLAYVVRQPDGLDVNGQMVEDGYAATLTIPPNVAHADELAAAAGRARSAGRGLWSACAGPHQPLP